MCLARDRLQIQHHGLALDPVYRAQHLFHQPGIGAGVGTHGLQVGVDPPQPLLRGRHEGRQETRFLAENAEQEIDLGLGPLFGARERPGEAYAFADIEHRYQERRDLAGLPYLLELEVEIRRALRRRLRRRHLHLPEGIELLHERSLDPVGEEQIDILLRGLEFRRRDQRAQHLAKVLPRPQPAAEQRVQRRRALPADVPVARDQEHSLVHGAENLRDLRARRLRRPVARAQATHEFHDDKNEVEQREQNGDELDPAQQRRPGDGGGFQVPRQIVGEVHEPQVARHELGRGDLHVPGGGIRRCPQRNHDLVHGSPVRLDLVQQLLGLGAGTVLFAECACPAVGVGRLFEAQQGGAEGLVRFGDLGHARLVRKPRGGFALEREQRLGELLRIHAQIAAGIDLRGVDLDLARGIDADRQHPEVQDQEEADGDNEVAVLAEASGRLAIHGCAKAE